MGKIAQDDEAVKSGRVYTCIVKTILDGLDDDDFRVVSERIDNRRNSIRGLSTWLAAYDLYVSDGAIQKHRAKRCVCFRALEAAS
jgi:hypothetical protein